MKSQWQSKSLERSKPLKKLSLKNKLSSSKEKHKFTNSLMAVSEYISQQNCEQLKYEEFLAPPLTEVFLEVCERLRHQDWLFSAGLGHYKNRAEKQRMMDGAMSSSSSSTSALHAPRSEAPSLCKAERLQALNTPLGPYDRNYGRKRLREHSLERADCECLEDWTSAQKSSALSSLNSPLVSCSLPQDLCGLERPLSATDQPALCTSQPPPSPTLHVLRERHASGCRQPEHLEHTCTEAPPLFLSFLYF